MQNPQADLEVINDLEQKITHIETYTPQQMQQFAQQQVELLLSLRSRYPVVFSVETLTYSFAEEVPEDGK